MGEQTGAIRLPDIFGDLSPNEDSRAWEFAERIKLALDLLNVGIVLNGTSNFRRDASIADASATLSAVEFVYGVLSINPTADRVLTTPTATNIINQFGASQEIGSSFDVTILIVGGGGFSVDLVANVGVGVFGSPTINRGSGTWTAIRVAAAAVFLYRKDAKGNMLTTENLAGLANQTTARSNLGAAALNGNSLVTFNASDFSANTITCPVINCSGVINVASISGTGNWGTPASMFVGTTLTVPGTCEFSAVNISGLLVSTNVIATSNNVSCAKLIANNSPTSIEAVGIVRADSFAANGGAIAMTPAIGGGLTVGASLVVNVGFGCNGRPPQVAAPVNGASPVVLADVVDLCNQLRAALVANGICI